MLETQFKRQNIENVVAQADENGVLIVYGWSVPIPKAKAIEYVNAYNTGTNDGFYEYDGKVILSHNGGKITFTEKEGKAIVKLIESAYLDS